MSFTYSPTLITPLDQVRFQISDTVEEEAQFQNEEIAAMLAMNGNDVLSTSIALVRQLTFRYAGHVDVQADDVRKSSGVLFDRYSGLLDALLELQGSAAGRTTSGVVGGAWLRERFPKIYP